jgi:hypothetical protein
MTDNSKGTSLLYFGINYGRKKFYDTAPWKELKRAFFTLKVCLGCGGTTGSFILKQFIFYYFTRTTLVVVILKIIV